MTRPSFGQWVAVDAKAVKDRGPGSTLRGCITTWERHLLPDVREGMYIGWRTVYEGEYVATRHGDYEGGYDDDYHFERKNQLEVWLVVFSETENVVYAYPEDCEYDHE